MTYLPITSVFAAAFALGLIALSVPITLRRVTVGDMVGDSADEVLHHRIRAQGNFTEYVPLGMVTLGLVEAQGSAAWLVVAIGGALAFGRLLHATGMLRPSASLRGFGMIFTYLALIAAAACLCIEAI